MRSSRFKSDTSEKLQAFTGKFTNRHFPIPQVFLQQRLDFVVPVIIIHYVNIMVN